MKLRSLATLAIVAIFSWSATAEDSALPADAKPIIARVEADNCGSCKGTHSLWKRLVAAYQDSTEIVVLDVSDEARGTASAETAKALGIQDFLQANLARPGTIGILMPDGSQVEIFKGRLDKRDYDAAIEKARRWIADPEIWKAESAPAATPESS